MHGGSSFAPGTLRLQGIHGRQTGPDSPFQRGRVGAFDVVAGKVKRAPVWMQKACLEWFYRFLQEPRDKWKVEVVDSFHFLYLFLVHDLWRRR